MKSNNVLSLSKARATMNKNMVDGAKDVPKGPEDFMKIAKERSKDLMESNSLPLRRETVLLDLSQLDELILNITRWFNLFSKASETKLTEEVQYLKVMNNVLYAYLVAHDKKLLKPLEGDSSQLCLLKIYLAKFKKFAETNDVFMDMEYQPHIFLRTFAGKLSEVALSISLRLKNEDEVMKSSKGYFPRCERMGYRDFASDREKKIAYVEKVTETAAQEKAKKK